MRGEVLRRAPGVGAQERRTAGVAARPMRGEAERLRPVAVAGDEHRLGHVERDQRQAGIVSREARPRRRRPLAVVEEAVGLPKDEVVLVPEAAGGLRPELAGGEVVDGEVARLRPRPDDLQGLPVGPPVLALRVDPGVVGWNPRRVDGGVLPRHRHAALVELRAEAAAAVVGDEGRPVGARERPDEGEVVAVALRREAEARLPLEAFWTAKGSGLPEFTNSDPVDQHF